MSKRKPRGYWTEERIRAEALKHSTRHDFVKGNKGAYYAATHLGILDSVCEHMTVLRVRWTDEMLADEAAKHQTRAEFKKANAAAVCAARKRGIMDQICAHMVSGNKLRAAKRMWTHDQYCAWLAEHRPDFTCLEEYAGATEPIKHQCDEGHTFKARPTNVKKGRGCPYCTGKGRRTPEEYQQFLREDGRGIVALEDYVSGNKSILHRCAVGHEWTTKPNGIKHRGLGCPYCGGQRLEQPYEEWLAENRKDLRVLEPYRNSVTPIKHECVECEHQWPVKPSHVKSSGVGCPSCKQWSTDDDAVYIWRHVGARHGRRHVYKVGVTSARLGDKRIAICADKNEMESELVILSEVACRASDLEKQILEMGIDPGYPPEVDGYTEFRAFTARELERATRLIEQAA